MRDSYRVPIVLGVVGHRDIDPANETVLFNAFRQILQEFRKAFPASPLVLLSNLAEGADQLAVKAALAENESIKRNRRRKKRRISESDIIKIQTPLPFPSKIFLKSSSFSSSQSRKTFHELFKESDSFVIDLPVKLRPKNAAGWETLIHQKKKRHQCYANAGGYIVRHCLALIALWDGNPTGRPSGTAELVNFKRTGTPPAEYPWSGPLRFGSENGPVYQIYSPRSTPPHSPNPQNSDPGSIRVLLPESVSPLSQWQFKQSVAGWFGSIKRKNRKIEANSFKEYRQFYETCMAIENFNQDARKHLPHLRKRLRVAMNKRVGNRQKAIGFTMKILGSIARFREIPAFLAAKYENYLLYLEGIVFIGFFGAALSFHTYAHLFKNEKNSIIHQPRLLLAFLLLLFICGIIVLLVRYLKLDKRRLDYRAFAEALRVRLYWGLAGIGQSVADTYLGQLRSEMAWIRRALQNSRPEPGFWSEIFYRRSRTGQLNCLNIVQEKWIKEQTEYYKKNTKKNQKRAKIWRFLGIGFAVIGWLLASALCLGWFLRIFLNPHHPKPWILVLSGMLVVTGGLFIVYRERRSFKELSKQYDRLAIVFSRGDKEMETHLSDGNVAGAQDVIEELGREALAEHAQWLILRRARPFELHIGG